MDWELPGPASHLHTGNDMVTMQGKPDKRVYVRHLNPVFFLYFFKSYLIEKVSSSLSDHGSLEQADKLLKVEGQEGQPGFALLEACLRKAESSGRHTGRNRVRIASVKPRTSAPQHTRCRRAHV